MHIWLTLPSLSKKTGGLANVVQHLSEHLVSLGASVTVLTFQADSDCPEALPQDQRVNVINVSKGTRGRLGGGFRKMVEDLLVPRNVSIVHNFGIWLPENHAVASVCENLQIPLVCSPCGMLSQWGLQHKAWKKRLAWWLYQRRDLSRAGVLVATAEQEVQDIRRWVPGKPIALVPNGVDIPAIAPEAARGVDHRTRTVVFLGRISPVKGLKNLVEAWHITRPSGWRCILAGPDEAGHQKELDTIIRLRNLQNTFQFVGLMEDEQKWALLREADLFVLPSFTENFGFAAAEALACAVPVITTKGTPWKELVDCRSGWWVDIGVEPLAEALRNATTLTDDERQQMGKRGRQLMQDKYSWDKIAKDTNSVYHWLLGDSLAPDCVRLD